MTGLRERQKQDRRDRILEAARRCFAHSGYDGATIEGIAELAGVSGVTVHNYYGTKSGVLLAMVAENDRTLLARIERELARPSDAVADLTLRFARIIRDHALANLDKALWRQAIAASIIDADSRFAREYHQLDAKLARSLVGPIETLKAAGRLRGGVSAEDLSQALFNLQNARFVQYVSVERLEVAAVEDLLRRDLAALFPGPQGA